MRRASSGVTRGVRVRAIESLPWWCAAASPRPSSPTASGFRGLLPLAGRTDALEPSRPGGQISAQGDLQPAVGLAFVLGLRDRETADLAGARHVRAAVGLGVEALDLDDAYGLDVGWQRDVREPREIGSFELLARDEPCQDRSVLRDDPVGFCLDCCDACLAQVLQRKVHPRPIRIDRAAGYQRAEQAVDGADQHVQRGVVAHDRVAALPVDRAAHRAVARGAGVLQHVPDRAPVPALSRHAGLAVAPCERSGVRRLAAAPGIERGAIQGNGAAVHRGDGRVELSHVTVVEVQQLGHFASARAASTSFRRTDTPSLTTEPFRVRPVVAQPGSRTGRLRFYGIDSSTVIDVAVKLPSAPAVPRTVTFICGLSALLVTTASRWIDADGGTAIFQT